MTITRTLGLLTGTALLLAGCGTPPPATGAPMLPSLAATTAPAALVDHGAVELLPGTVRSASAAAVMARVSGVVARIDATPGQRVAAGAVLVELDAQELAARRDQAKAVAAQSAADFERAKALLAREALGKAEYDAAQARAAGTAAAANEAAIIAGYATIRAPFAGVVVRKHAEVGDLLTPGRALIELEDPAAMRLEVEVPESLSARLALGARLRVSVPAAGFDQVAPVVEITPAADPVSRTVLAKLALPAEAAGLRSGLYGRVAVATAGGRLLTVPSAAVVRRGQLDAVFVADQGVARLRLVRTGGADAGRTTIRAGLTAGEAVVVEGAAQAQDGQPLTLRANP